MLENISLNNHLLKRILFVVLPLCDLCDCLANFAVKNLLIQPKYVIFKLGNQTQAYLTQVQKLKKSLAEFSESGLKRQSMPGRAFKGLGLDI